MRVYIASVDDKYGLFWEDGLPIFDDNPSEPAFMIRAWKRRGWAKRFAEQHGWELFEPDVYPHLPARQARLQRARRMELGL